MENKNDTCVDGLGQELIESFKQAVDRVNYTLSYVGDSAPDMEGTLDLAGYMRQAIEYLQEYLEHVEAHDMRQILKISLREGECKQKIAKLLQSVA